VSVTISLTEVQIFTALRSFLASILPSGVTIIRGQQNQTTLPPTPYVVMTPITRTRLATNIDSITPPGTLPTTQDFLTPIRLDVQIDCYSTPNAVSVIAASDLAQIVQTLWRDDFGVSYFAGLGISVTPLYTGEPRAYDFVNDQDQYEYRCGFDISMEIDPIITAPQQYANVLNPALFSVVDQIP
jgi:hypothetical protein